MLISLLNTAFTSGALCDFPSPTFLFFSSNVPPLVYYSHLPIALLSLGIGIFVLLKNWRGLPHRLLFLLTLAFATWVIMDSVFWASNRSDVIMFVWSIQILIEPIVYISGLYIAYVLLDGKDISFFKKILIATLYLPIVVLVPTSYALSGFDISSCLSVEGPIAFYTYIFEIVLSLWLIAFSLNKYRNAQLSDERANIFFISAALLLLLFSFAFGNIISSFTENWNYAQIGLLMMPIFIALLTYVVIRFGIFNFKVISAQALVVGIWFLVFALLFVRGESNTLIVVLITLAFVSLIGYLLNKSVGREVAQREKLEELSMKLASTNTALEKTNERLRIIDQRKSEFVSIVSHQLRTPITAIKGYASMILEDSYGKLSPEMQPPVEKIFRSSNRLAQMVTDFLDVSKIEQGTMSYVFTSVDIGALIADLGDEFAPVAKKKKLKFTVRIPKNEKFIATADDGKVRQIFSNLIDNSIKYTPKGSVAISVARDEERGMIMVNIKDTGIGLSQDDIHHLFGKFTRGTGGQKQNTDGSGLGLYVAKNMLEAQKGNLWVDSEGPNKGSTFFVELRAE